MRLDVWQNTPPRLDKIAPIVWSQKRLQSSQSSEDNTVTAVSTTQSTFQIGKETDVERWEKYLRRLSEEPVSLPNQFAAYVRSVWNKILTRAGVPLRPPVAGPGGEAGFQFSWNSDNMYLDIDIDQSGSFGWYYRDRVTSTADGSDEIDLTTPPEKLLRLLARFCRIQ
ncbi:MAG: hypothetical protein GY854_29795 [Deltaproteobacteria bacterium]|nr:hypothetical protein [Deltaproteobacteria bacterium]